MALSISVLAAVLSLQPSPESPANFYDQVTKSPSDLAVVHKVAEIPPEVSALPWRRGPVADSDQSYELGDTGAGPHARLVWAARAGQYYLINGESGGRGYDAMTWVFDLGSGQPRFAGAISARRPAGETTPLNQINRYRSFADFQTAVAAHQVLLNESGNLFDAPLPVAVCLLHPAVTDPVRQVSALPADVVAVANRNFVGAGTILTDDAASQQHLKWAVDVGGVYVIDVAQGAFDRVGLIAPGNAREAWTSSYGGRFESFAEFQAFFSRSMSAGTERHFRQIICP